MHSATTLADTCVGEARHNGSVMTCFMLGITVAIIYISFKMRLVLAYVFCQFVFTTSSADPRVRVRGRFKVRVRVKNRVRED